MTRHKTAAIAATGLAALAVGALSFTTLAQAAPPSPPPAAAPAPAASASAQLTEDLRWMREEERLARDLYAALAGTYDGARPFSMITKSEQRHHDAIGTLLTRYQVADPSAGLPAGDYAFDELDALYAQLLDRGKQSIQEAHAVGVTYEEKDIADLRAAIARTDAADAKQVFENLLRGSEQHLAAFQREPGTFTGPNGQGMGPRAGNDNRQRGPMVDGTCDGTCTPEQRTERQAERQSQRDANRAERQGQGGQGMRGGRGPGGGQPAEDCPVR